MSRESKKTTEAFQYVGKRLRRLEAGDGGGELVGAVAVDDTVPPTAPGSLTVVSATEGSVSLSWLPSTDNVAVALYQVHRDGTLIAETAANVLTLIDTEVQPASTYIYAVYAVDTSGNVSASSDTATAITGAAPADTSPPSTPTGLALVTVEPTSVSLSWNPSTDNVAVALYRVYRGGVLVGSPSSTVFNDNTVLPSQNYTYTVDAIDTSGNSSGQSNVLNVTTPALPVSGIWYASPDGLAVNDGSITNPWSLAFALNGAGGGAVLAGHTLYLRGGTYPITATQVITGFEGEAANRITVKAYPGERVTIRNEGGVSLFSTIDLQSNAYVDFFGIEFTMRNYTRTVQAPGGVYHIEENTAHTQTGVRFFGCFFHDVAGRAIGSFASSDAIEYNGCIIYLNGSSASEDYAALIQSATGKTKKLKDNVFAHNASHSIAAYSEDAATLEGITLDGNVVFKSGSLYDNPATAILLGGLTVPFKNGVVQNNFVGHLNTPVDADTRALQMGNFFGGGEGTWETGPISNSQDGRWSSDGTTFNATAALLTMGRDSTGRMSSFMRFQNCPIPEGATITAASIRVRAKNTRAGAPAFVTIKADKSSLTPAAPTSNADATGRTRTTAGVDWNPSGWTADTFVTTPDFATVVQEIVNQSGWAVGNPVVIYFDEDGDQSTSGDLWFASYESTTDPEPTLTVEYTVGGATSTPTTLTIGVASSSQDGRWSSDGTTFSSSAGLLTIGADGTGRRSAFMRFQNLTIPPFATITDATITVRARNTRTGAPAFVRIKAEKSLTPAAPTTAVDATGRTRTTAFQAWNPADWTSGLDYVTPDFANVVQEIVNQPGWASGNPMLVFFDENGNQSTQDLWFASWDDATDPEPTLEVTYVTGATDGGAESVSVTGNFTAGAPVDLSDAPFYDDITVTGNTFLYTGSHIGNTEAAFPSNTFGPVPTTGVRIFCRTLDWDSSRANLIIYNWSGAASVTVSAADLAGLNIQNGDQYELRNVENYFSDVVVGTYNGSSFTVNMTGRTQAAPVGTIPVPATAFPFFGVFRLIVFGSGGPPPPPPPVDTTPPSVPTGLSATPSAGQIALSWNQSTDNTGIAGYTVRRGGTVIATTSGTSYTDTAVTGGTTYSYTVSAYDAAGNHSAQSSSASATVPAVTGGKFIAPNGSSSGDGSSESPWSLVYALDGGAGGQIDAGDTVYLKAGTYTVGASFDLDGLVGTSGNPIIFKPEGGRVNIQSNSGKFTTMVPKNVQHTHFYDLEFSKTGYTRTTPTTTSSGESFMKNNVNYTQHGLKFFGCIFHDHRGFGVHDWHSPGSGAEMNGCVFYYNGQNPQHDHNVYLHNWGDNVKLYRDCIFHNPASFNFHAYDDNDYPIDNVRVEGTVFFNPMSLYTGHSSQPSSRKPNLLIGGRMTATYDPQVVNCFFYSPTQGSGTYQIRIGYGDASLGSVANVHNAVLTGNFSVGRTWYLEQPTMSNSTINNNKIYHGGGWLTTSLNRVNAGSGNVVASVPTSGSEIFVRKYTWDSKRANVILFNFGSASNLTVTSAMLSAAGVDIQNGDTYELRNAEDFFGDILTGTYNGSSISIPMTGRTQAQPVGGLSKPPTAFPKFGCFVLKVTS